MTLKQTISIIMGANIGTTLTAWLMSLIGVESDNIFITMLKPKSFAPLFALIGVCLILFSKKSRRKDIGSILMGFAILMYGMVMMSDAAEPLTGNESFISILTFFNDSHFVVTCILGVLVGAVFTGIIQSSAASIGILQALSLSGKMNYGLAIPLIMGLNIGTCVTSLISSIGVNKKAKRVAVLHTLIKIIGTFLCAILFYLGLFIFGKMGILEQSISPVGIAVAHSVFNIVTTILLMPFSKYLEKLVCWLVKEKKGTAEEYEILDERLLGTPSFAVSECGRVRKRMAEISFDAMQKAIGLLDKYDPKIAEEVRKEEETVDVYEDKLGTFLVKLSAKALNEKDSRLASEYLSSLSDFERISDHAVNVLETVEEMKEKKIGFSPKATQEIKVIISALNDVIAITKEAVLNDDDDLAKKVEPIEQVIDILKTQIKNNHIARLQDGLCTIELGFILSDLLTDVERVSDHCSNIAADIVEVKMSRFDSHKYLSAVKAGEDQEFNRAFEECKNRYRITE